HPPAPDCGRDIHRDSLAGLWHRGHEVSAAISWIDSDAADDGDARVRNRCDDSPAFCRILACHLSRQLNHSDDVVASDQAERRVARGLQLAARARLSPRAAKRRKLSVTPAGSSPVSTLAEYDFKMAPRSASSRKSFKRLMT